MENVVGEPVEAREFNSTVDDNLKAWCYHSIKIVGNVKNASEK